MKNAKRSSCSYSQETKKIRKLLNEEVKLGIHPSSGSETEDVDVQKQIYPLGHYMNNREEMIEQMFSIIKGDKLNKMLPPILKDMPLDELKADCLIHLLGMSKKRIMAILEGKEIDSSSDSETHSDSSSPRKKAKPIVKPIIIKQEGCSDISDNSEEVILIDPDRESYLNSSKDTVDKVEGSGKCRKHYKKYPQHKNTNLSDKKVTNSLIIQELNNVEMDKSEDTHESSPDSKNSNDEKIPTKGKTLLEIVELEMRARVIRALLHKNETPRREEDVQLVEKQNPQRNVSDEEETNKIIPKKKFRKKKRKSDDVIVITPKVVTIDLTDENDVRFAKKKPKESTTTSKFDITASLTNIKDDVHNEIETIDNYTVNDKNDYFHVIDVDKDVTEESNKKEQDKSTEPDVSLQLSSQSSEQCNIENVQKTEQQKSNWAQRWLESKDVKKVVSTSKICANIRKRIRNAKLAKQNKVEPQQTGTQEIFGSVDEYQLLSKSNNISDSNSNSVSISISESSLLPNEEGLEKHVQTQSKETSTSVEQVQDVTSTKNETQTDDECIQECIIGVCNQENVGDRSNKENVIGDSNSNSCDCDISSNLKLESNHINESCLKLNIAESGNDESSPIKICDVNLVLFEKSNLNDLKTALNLDSTQEKSQLLLENNTGFDNQPNDQPKLDVKEGPEERIRNLALSPVNGLVYESLQNLEQIQLINNSVNTKIDCLQSNITPKSSLNEELYESKSTDILSSSVAKDNCCDSSSSPFKINKSLIQNNEPETLEINITDEDRNIDGILDEKLENK